jgi:hypothetical protein
LPVRVPLEALGNTISFRQLCYILSVYIHYKYFSTSISAPVYKSNLGTVR